MITIKLFSLENTLCRTYDIRVASGVHNYKEDIVPDCVKTIAGKIATSLTIARLFNLLISCMDRIWGHILVALVFGYHYTKPII